MRIGFMGGTFSPPHIGHLNSARDFIDEMQLSKLIIIPAKVSPFKVSSKATAKDSDRFQMSELCFSSLDSENCSVEISDMEISKNETSYTIETIKLLKEKYPSDELIMFVGSDMFLSLEKWRESKSIFSLCHIYTRCREENELENMLLTKAKYESSYGADITFSNKKEIIISSTDIRHALNTKNYQSCENLLTDNVLRYIINKKLYYRENHE